MNLNDRRSFVRSVISAAVAAGTRVIPLFTAGDAFSQQVTTRYNALSAEGKRMLGIYARAVKALAALPATDPRGWLFQWYTHGVRGDRTKDQEITRVFGVAVEPARSLAAEVWSTCEPHWDNSDPNMFLPWHRAYVLSFERLVRAVVREPTFTLPYWNYSAPGAARILPDEFRRSGDATYGSLFRSDRRSAVNAGRPIDEGAPGDILAPTALGERTYGGDRGEDGFNAALDDGLHGTIHVRIGTGVGMGSVPWAANDPIFWLHHCNIDRLWASWNSTGGTNPGGAWAARRFVFADETGGRKELTAGQMSSLGSLGYAYDALEPRPGGREAMPPSGEPRVIGVARPSGREAVGIPLDRPVTLTLQPQQPGGGALREAVRQNRSVYLVIRGRRASAPPQALFHVYLDVPPEATPEVRKQRYVGTFNFFGLGGHQHGGRKKDVRINVTEAVRRLARTDTLPTVTIVPDEGEVAGSPAVGEVSLEER